MPDDIAARAPRAIAHMNADHADALIALCTAFGNIPDASAATMTALDAAGFDLTVTSGAGRSMVRIDFDPPLTDAEQIRPAMVELTRRARLAR